MLTSKQLTIKIPTVVPMIYITEMRHKLLSPGWLPTTGTKEGNTSSHGDAA